MSTALDQLQRALSRLRLKAGQPTYERLATLTRFSQTAVNDAFIKPCRPSRQVTRAIVRALDGDEDVVLRLDNDDRPVHRRRISHCATDSGHQPGLDHEVPGYSYPPVAAQDSLWSMV
ncbi:hypothetical protein [Actinokineospora globicatena]|uniref:hypothetical protein n=1 Tax=Actinokineospora globicatena TaxID=103729 RepID=UPI0020A33C07|nr:hypothetical protein [Actinokineospora globicatena]MCP2303186.1 hypothetical protein [Actinokineospora globicatena]GLW79694.1 hypothetical protein Aglo01_41750 [Actinokineospora globicatena]GLW85896.1 hypothetical protein Aglo02_35360 [Actinokineospora globicatena]